ncbi:MAG: hypothetical protein V8S97_03040 [Oscillospiraceae bacterium]
MVAMFQYTAIGEFTRLRFLAAYSVESTYPRRTSCAGCGRGTPRTKRSVQQ